MKTKSDDRLSKLVDRVEWDNPEHTEINEIVLVLGTVHIEKLSDRTIWMRVSDGESAQTFIFYRKGKHIVLTTENETMAKTPIKIKGFRVKDGKVEKSPRRLDTSAKIRQKKSTKQRPVRRTAG